MYLIDDAGCEMSFVAWSAKWCTCVTSLNRKLSISHRCVYTLNETLCTSLHNSLAFWRLIDTLSHMPRIQEKSAKPWEVQERSLRHCPSWDFAISLNVIWMVFAVDYNNLLNDICTFPWVAGASIYRMFNAIHDGRKSLSSPCIIRILWILEIILSRRYNEIYLFNLFTCLEKLSYSTIQIYCILILIWYAEKNVKWKLYLRSSRFEILSTDIRLSRNTFSPIYCLNCGNHREHLYLRVRVDRLFYFWSMLRADAKKTYSANLAAE